MSEKEISSNKMKSRKPSSYNLFIPTTTPPGERFDIPNHKDYHRITITYGKWDFKDLSVLALYIYTRYIKTGILKERGHDGAWIYAARNYTVNGKDITSDNIRSRLNNMKTRDQIFDIGPGKIGIREDSIIKWTKDRYADKYPYYSTELLEKIRKAKNIKELKSLIQDQDEMIHKYSTNKDLYP